MNEKLSNLETGMEKMSKDRAESSCAIQSKLDALLRNSLAQDKSVTDKQPGTRVDFVEPPRKKRETTPLPRTDNNIAPGVTRTAMKGGASNSMMTPGETSAHTGVPTDAMKWASTWNTMDRTLEAFATRSTNSSDRGSGKSRKTIKKPNEFKEDSDGCIDTLVEVMRLHLEQENLNDERQACPAVLSNLEGTALSVC